MSVRLYRSLDELPADFGPSAVSIGNFDGVHEGHKALFRKVVSVARANGWKAGVLTFSPHPATIVAPSRAPLLMTTPEQRVALMASHGVEEAIILPFTGELALLSPEEFVRQILIDRMQVRAVVVGHNFRFGHRAAGDIRLLAELGSRLGFETHVINEV
ncbi:MAG: bifunctional riboflavin kinase/FAD synthetase, partial [Bryobacteraceae bacterium]